MNSLTRHKRRMVRYRRRGLTVVGTFRFPNSHSYGYQLDDRSKLKTRLNFFKDLIALTVPTTPWVCPYKFDPNSPICEGYHLAGCDNSCDRIHTMQLRREGKIW